MWKDASSDPFSISNDHRFYFIIDNLIKMIVRNNIGCKVGTVFTGILVYADDIILLSPSKQGLQFIIDTCSSYAERHRYVIQFAR